MKGDRGFVPYPSDVPLVSSIGGQKIILVKDIKGLVKTLKEKGIYTVARIVVFKDNLLGEGASRPGYQDVKRTRFPRPGKSDLGGSLPKGDLGLQYRHCRRGRQKRI